VPAARRLLLPEAVTTTLVRFLVPGTSGRFRCGGLSVELQTARILSGLCPTEIVTYREQRNDYPFFEDLLQRGPEGDTVLWIVSWGFDVPRLVNRARANRQAAFWCRK